MSCGSLPPVPGLIPISALLVRNTSTNNPSSSCCKNSNDLRECTPCIAIQKEVMGEQRSRRTGSQPTVDLIDIARRSRGLGATPQASSGKARTERRRKSDKRREHRGGRRKRSANKQQQQQQHQQEKFSSSSSSSSASSSSRCRSSERVKVQGGGDDNDKCVNPRVNPIFVWVRQEDTHIVDVKCEDYDKRNRIVLTKTAQGWRAIPRTETLVPNLKAAVTGTATETSSNATTSPKEETTVDIRQHHHHQARRSRKNSKVKRRSAAVQVDGDVFIGERDKPTPESPTWNMPVNIESHLPSHLIHVNRNKCSPPPQREQITPERTTTPMDSGGGDDEGDDDGEIEDDEEDAVITNVNTTPDQTRDAQVPVASTAVEAVAAAVERSGAANNKVCDVSPLDNLLAVAELEFNQQIQAEAWRESVENAKSRDDDVVLETSLDRLIKCDDGLRSSFGMDETKGDDEDEDDYNEDDENNLAMDDILNRLEQSLQSPDVLCIDLSDSASHCDVVDALKETATLNDDDQKCVTKDTADGDAEIADVSDKTDENAGDSDDYGDANCDNDTNEDVVEKTPTTTTVSGSSVTSTTTRTVPRLFESVSSTTTATTPSVAPAPAAATGTSSSENDDKPTDLSTSKKIECLTITLPDDDMMPTDLSVPKKKPRSPSPGGTMSPRPSSRCSETIQSPQPSGLPAVPPSPDVQATGTNKSSLYLESLLSSASQKISLNSEVTITRQKEPLDFGKCRKSASPTVTCSSSEDVNNICSSSGEPEVKKTKLMDDITLRAMLEANTGGGQLDNGGNRKTNEKGHVVKNVTPETSRLLELLTSESEPDALTQLKQLQSDPNLNLPDPMLIPKDRLSQILMTPGKEIPKLLVQRPELRLPEALAFPRLLQDPDILVITLAQLETIIRKQTLLLPAPDKPKQPNNNNSATAAPTAIPIGKKNAPEAASPKERPKKHHREHPKPTNKVPPPLPPHVQSDINVDTGMNLNGAAAFNQMMWLPYIHQLEVAALAFGNANGADFLKALSSAFPSYSNPQLPGGGGGGIGDMSQLFAAAARFPPPSPGIPSMATGGFGSGFDFPSLWHENALHQQQRIPAAGHHHHHQQQQQQQQHHQYERNKNAYREYMEKVSLSMAAAAAAAASTPSKNHHQPSIPKHSQSSGSGKMQSHFPTPPQLPFHPSLHGIQQQQQHPFVNLSTAAANFQSSITNGRTPAAFPSYGSHCNSQSASKYNKSSGGGGGGSGGGGSTNPASFCRDRYDHIQGVKNANHKSKQTVPPPSPFEAAYKSLFAQQQQQQQQHHNENHTSKKTTLGADFAATQQPMDLSSGTTTSSSTLRSRHNNNNNNNNNGSGGGGNGASRQQSICDSGGPAAKSLRFDDIPEVGSTTASIEDMTAAAMAAATHMQESQKHLWHPLFGNQKPSSSPWNWSTTPVTATGE